MPALTFTALTADDFDQLRGWLAAPHVVEWYGPRLTADAVQAKYGPRVTGKEPCRCFIARVDGVAVGMLQTYSWADEPRGAATVDARPGDAGLDYLIGDPARAGHGLGRALVTAFVDEVIFADPAVTAVKTTVAVANRRSWRCLQNAGFQRSGARALPGETGPQYVLSLTRPTPEHRDPFTRLLGPGRGGPPTPTPAPPTSGEDLPRDTSRLVAVSDAEYVAAVRCVTMPCCGFTFDADHTDPTGDTYTCPNCPTETRA